MKREKRTYPLGMRLTALLLSALVILIFAPSFPSARAEGESLLNNGDFSQGAAHWGVYTESGGSGKLTAKDGKGALEVKKSGKVDYAVQLFYDGFALRQGGRYRFAFTVTSTADRQITARIQLNGGDYHAYCVKDVKLAAGAPQHVELDFEMTEKSDPAPRLCFNCGTPAGAQALEAHTLTFEAVEVILLDSTKVASEAAKAGPAILADQLGYLPDAGKTAFFRGAALGDSFEVLDESGKAVFTGRQGKPLADAASGDTVSSGDFSAVTAPGTYRLRAGGQESAPFAIGADVYTACFKAAVRFFYLQRCGCALDKTLAGDFAHPACHTALATVYGAAETKDVSGGWHDAGDYGRYVVPGAKAAADLMLAYESNPALFGDDLRIPESGNGTPDVLDEVRYELDWLLKMQDEASGGVYHKVTCAAFPGFVLPDQETAPLILSPVSTAATGDFSAVTALAARVYKDADPAFAAACLAASQKAWAYLTVHADNAGGFHNPAGIVTGEYGDGQDADERYWAACELYRTTGQAEYRDAADRALSAGKLSGLGWADVGTYGHLAYLGCGRDAVTPASYDRITGFLGEQANVLHALSKSDGYGNTLGLDYPWGSNMNVANNAVLLMAAAGLDPARAADYQTTAKQALHYLLGANPMATCYVTGCGSLSASDPHHRVSVAVGHAVPGMLAGGPSKGLEDPFAKATLTGQPPAKCYADNNQSYSTNEVAIYWNSPLVWLMAEVMK